MDASIIEWLEKCLDDIVSSMIERFREKVEFYREMPVPVIKEVELQVRRICENFLTFLREGKLPEAFLQEIRSLASNRELQGFELKDLISTIGEGREVAWGYLKDWFQENGSLSDLYEMVEALDRYYNWIVSSMAATYLEEHRESIARFNHLLNKFRVILNKGELLERITSEACQNMGYSRAVFFIYERDALLPVSAASREDENWSRIYLEPMRYYPLSPFGKTPECEAFFKPRIVTVRKAEVPLPSFSLVKPPPKSAFALVPINPTESPKGLLYVEAQEHRFAITKWETELLQTYADTVGLALENTQLYREVFLKGRALDHLMSKVNTAHEEERSRIARELHDSIAQSLLRIIYSTGFALDFLKEDPPLAAEEMEEVQAHAKECLQELRAIIANLRPTSLEILGLKETIMRYAEQFEEEYAISTEVNLEGLEHLTKAAELAIFRILQEALTNVRKHSGADAVEITSQAKDGQLILTIRDNGKGFDLSGVEDEQERGRHLGLLAMRERAELMGGDFKVISVLGRGTVIIIKLPLMSKERHG
jgi:two-component system sensor histidine kinase DegS